MTEAASPADTRAPIGYVKDENNKETNNNNLKDENKSTEESKDEKETLDALEAALAQLGHFGWYQKYMLFFLCIPNVLSAMYSLNYVFVADQVPFR